MEGRFGVGGDCFRMSTATMLSAEDLAGTAAAASATRPALAFSALLASSATIVERTRDGVAGHDGAGGVELLAGGSAQGVDGLAVVDHVVPLPEELEPLLVGMEEVVLGLVVVLEEGTLNYTSNPTRTGCNLLCLLTTTRTLITYRRCNQNSHF